MTRKVTRAAIKKIISKGLTGWEAGKLLLQDIVDSYLYQESVLTETDIDTIQNAPMEGADVRDYNMFMALCRAFTLDISLGNGRAWTPVYKSAILMVYFGTPRIVGS